MPILPRATMTGSVDNFLSHLDNPKQQPDGSFLATCPAHDDTNPSLHISRGDGGRCLAHCFAGCTIQAITASVGMTVADLSPSAQPRPTIGPNGRGPSPNGHRADTALGPIIATYEYPDADGCVNWRVTRHRPKTFRPWHRDDAGRWVIGGRVPHLYNLPATLYADAGEPVLVAEGEADVDSLIALGFVATTNAGGAGKWRPEHSESLAGRRVVSLPDHDSPGREHAETVARSLDGVAAEVRIVNLPGLTEKQDASDWLAAGGTADELRRLITESPVWCTHNPQNTQNPPNTGGAPNSEDCEYTDEPWSIPVPLVAESAPDVPPGALPGAAGTFADAVSVATQTPRALLVTLALGALSAVLAKRVDVTVRDGWTEPVNSFGVCAIGSGNRKTAAVQRITEPHVTWEIEEAERLAPKAALVANLRDVEENRLKKLKQAMAGTDDKTEQLKLRADIETITNLLLTDPELIPPAPHRLLAEDATPEALVELMTVNGGAIACISDEGDIFETMAGRFSKDGNSPNLGVFLKGHAGSDMPVDRIGRPTKRLRRPALTLSLAVQPETVHGLAGKPGFRGRGLLARFIWAIPPSLVGHRQLKPTPVPADVAAAWGRLIRGALALPLNDGQGTSEPRALTFSAAADEAMYQFEAALEPRLGPDGDLAHVADWGSKLAGLVARTSGLLHAAAAIEAKQMPWDHKIDKGCFQRAATLAETFLIPHALVAFGVMGADPVVGQAQAVLRRLARWPGDAFTRRDLHQEMRRTFRSVDHLDPVLRLLEDHGHIRRAQTPKVAGKPGRKPSPLFEINPLWRTQNAHIPQNCRWRGHSGGFEECVDSEYAGESGWRVA